MTVHHQDRVRLVRAVVAKLALLVLLAFIVATQAMAKLLAYHPSLGWNLEHLYPPWAFVLWAHQWQVPRAATAAAAAGALTFFLGFVAIINAHIRSCAKLNTYSYGAAHWATPEEVRATPLLSSTPRTGLILGEFDGQYLVHSGAENAMIVAPPRTGKSLGPVVMFLLSHVESVFVVDLKGELLRYTSRWRRDHAGNKILIVNPISTTSACWNPFEEIDIRSPSAFAEVQNLMEVLTDPDGAGTDGKSGNEIHFEDNAKALLIGLALFALCDERDGAPRASLPQLDNLLTPADEDNDSTIFERMVAYGRQRRSDPIAAAIAKAATDQIERAPEEAGGVLSTARRFLALYREPTIARVVSRSDFRVGDLMRNDSPVSLYLVLEPTDRQRLRPFVRLFINTAIKKLATPLVYEQVDVQWPWWQRLFAPLRAPKRETRVRADYKHPLTLVLEEMPSIRRIPILEESLAFLAGYGIRVIMIAQNMPQILDEKRGYGRNEMLSAAAYVKLFYCAQDPVTAKILSEACGTTTALHFQPTLRSGGGVASRTKQEHARPLLSKDEASQLRMPRKAGDEESKVLEPGEVVVLVSGLAPIRCKQALYFFDDVFVSRAALPPVTETDVLTVRVQL